MTEDYEYRLKKKDDEVNELKKKIDDMSNEFASMLRVFKFPFFFRNIFLCLGYLKQNARKS